MIRCTDKRCSASTTKALAKGWRWTWMFGWRCPKHLPGATTPPHTQHNYD